MDDEIRIKIPPKLLEGFHKEPYILLKRHPAGLWPIDLKMLVETGLWEELVSDQVFMENYEVVVMAK